MQKYILKLDTSYRTTGNSTGCGLDTLGIAFGFGDNNDIIDQNYDYILEQVNYAKRQWLNDEAEQYFKKSLTNEQIDLYVNDLLAYNEALNTYCNSFDSVDLSDYDGDNEAETALYETLSKTEGKAQDELYKLWLHGDYKESGLLDKSNRYYNDYSIELNDAGQGEVSATLNDNTIKIMIDDTILDDEATEADVISWLENDINNKAYEIYNKEKARHEASKVERERLTAYKAKQKQTADERKRSELLALKK